MNARTCPQKSKPTNDTRRTMMQGEAMTLTAREVEDLRERDDEEARAILRAWIAGREEPEK